MKNDNSPARSRELRHLELRGFLGPWTRCLKTGTVSRHLMDGRPFAQVTQEEGQAAADEDKTFLDHHLVADMGRKLLSNPAGCEIEK